MRWLYVLHGAAHANWGLSIPLWGLQNQLLKKSEKCNTFHAKLVFSWLGVAKTRTPSICARQRQREPKLILEGSEGGLFLRLFWGSRFFCFLMVWAGSVRDERPERSGVSRCVRSHTKLAGAVRRGCQRLSLLKADVIKFF